MMAVILAAAGVVYVGDKLDVTERPAMSYWQHVNHITGQAWHTLQISLGVAPGGAGAQGQPFRLESLCPTTIQHIDINGVTQLDAGKLSREAPLLEGKPYEMGKGLALFRYIKEAYQRQGLPNPVLSLHLDAVCQGRVVVQVTEGLLQPPPTMDEAMHIAQQAVVLPKLQGGGYGPRALLLPPHQGGWTWHDVPDEALAPQQVAPTVQPPAEVELSVKSATGVSPPSGWAEASADQSAPVAPGWQGETPNDENLLIVGVMVNGRVVSRGVATYMDESGGEIWIPLGFLVRVMGFPMQVDVAAGTVEGWFVREENRVYLNMANERLIAQGREQPYPKGQIQRWEDDMYVKESLVGKLFPLKARLDMNELMLVLTTTEALPEEERLIREATWEQMEAGKRLNAANDMKDAITLPYPLIDKPLVRLNGGLTTQRPSQGESTYQSNVSVQAEGALLYGSAQVTLGAERTADGQTKLVDGNALWSRDSLQPDMLGVLKATGVQVGDIRAAQPPLARMEAGGVGVRVHNRPFQRVDNPDRLVIEGLAPVGWDVEIYQDQSLLAYQRVDGTGKYVFEALPLRVGLNMFRILEFGPQGEKRERQERYFLGQDMPSKGEVQYDTTVYQPRGKVLHLADTPLETDPVQMAQRLELGLSNNAALQVGVYGVGAGVSQTQQGATAGLRGTWAGVYGTLDAMRTQQGGQSYATSARNTVAGVDMRIAGLMNRGFTGDSEITDAYEAEVSRMVRMGLVGVDGTLSYNTSRNASNAWQHTLNQRTGISYKGFNVSHVLEHGWGENSTPTWQGNAELAGRWDALSWRSSVAYNPNAPRVLTRLGINGQMPVADRLSVDGSYTFANQGDGLSTLLGNVRYDMGAYALGFQGQADSVGNMGLGLTFSSLLVPTDDGGYRQAHPNYGSGLGRALVRVFTDSNENGAYDEGEPLMEGVAIRNRTRGTRHLTKHTGLALVDNLPANTPVRLEIEDESINDIFLKPTKPSIAVVGNVGAKGTVDIPLVRFGEVEGTLFSANAQGVVRPVARLMVQLVNTQGDVVDYAVSENDGYFAMAPVPLGTYSVRLKPGEDTASGYVLSQPVTVALTHAQNTLSDVGVMLTEVEPVDATHATPEGGETGRAAGSVNVMP